MDISNNSWQENDSGNVNPSPLGYPPGMKTNLMRGLMHANMGATKRAWNRSNAMVLSTGTSTAYRIDYEVPPTALVKGEVFRWFAHVANTGPATLRVNEVATASIVHNDDGAALTAGNIPAGTVITTIYDGTAFRAIGLDKYGPRMSALETASTTLRGDFNTLVTTLNATTLKTDISNIKSAAKGTVTTGTVIFNYADGPYQSIEVAGAVTFALNGLPAIGGPLQINLTYSSGSITMPVGVVWDIGAGEKATSFGAVGVTWSATRRYRLVFEIVSGVLTGVIS